MKKVKTNIINTISVLSIFIILVYMAGLKSLWLDDIAQIHETAKGLTLGEIFRRVLYGDNNPPLSHLITAAWVHIAPFGERWIKLPNIIFVLVGSAFCAGIVSKGYSRRMAFVIFYIIALSRGTVTLAAYTVRPYGLLFLCSSFMIYEYSMLRFAEQKEKKYHFLFCVSMIMAAYTHYFSILVCFSMFLYDLVFFLRKKISYKFVFVYCIAAIFYIPWMLYALPVLINRSGSFWPEYPTVRMVFSTVLELLGSGKIMLMVFLASLLIILIVGITEKKAIQTDDPAVTSDWGCIAGKWKEFPLLLIFTILLVMGIDYVYSTRIHPEGSLWVTRYFISIMPCFYLLIGIGIEYGSAWIEKRGVKRLYINSALGLFCAIIISRSTHIIYEEQSELCSTPYREAIDQIMAQDDIYDDKTALYIVDYKLPDGWKYYITHAGTREEKIPIYEMENEDGLTGYGVIYYANMGTIKADEEMERYLEEHFTREELSETVDIRKYMRNDM